MVAIALDMAPTPQNSFQHMAPASSTQQQQSASQPPALPFATSSHGFNTSFDASLQPVAAMNQSAPSAYSQSFSGAPSSNTGFARSFGEVGKKAGARTFGDGEPQIYTAVYSGVSVYELEVGGVACMRRRDDGWLNATQILKVAGVDKGKRTKVLEKEILTGEHAKVQGGYGKYQGTWISYQRGREFCRQYGVEDILRPLLDYDIQPDGSGGQGQDTPTKEQAMAAQRKRFYNASQESRPNAPASNGTFFSNISPAASVALAAMSKAARLNSPAPPRPASAQARPAGMRTSSQPEGLMNGSQHSVASDAGDKLDSAYATQERPRKRLRADEGNDDMGPPALPYDVSMQSATPTEPNESFLYENALMQDSKNGAGEPIALPPLPSPVTEEQQEKMNLILDLFAEQGRTDYASHAALTQLSNEDLNMPLDASANNALHWAATLAKVPLLKLLIHRGASIWRGNAAGQSPLISAVLVNNCWEHSCFPELLELLGPLIEVRDLQGRTILHHIAVSSGIKGRAPSSKYYLEALLEFLVRVGTTQQSAAYSSVAKVAAAAVALESASSGEPDPIANLAQPRGPVTFVRFLQCIVNARDKAGNSALNLAARINNRSIIQQLLEIHADPDLPNNKGVSAKDFGIGQDPAIDPNLNGDAPGSSQSYAGLQAIATYNNTADGEQALAAGDSMSTTKSQVEEMGLDVISSTTSMLTQNLASHKELLRSRNEQIDRVNVQIQELSSLQKNLLEEMRAAKEKVRMREERRVKMENLRREIDKIRTARKQTPRQTETKEPEWIESSRSIVAQQDSGSEWNAQQIAAAKSSLPSKQTLEAALGAYKTDIATLQAQSDALRCRSTELETMYRKVVSLCTGVPEADVEANLTQLVAAVESEQGGLGEQEIGRVRDFLRKVDSSSGTQDDGVTLEVNPTISALAAKAAAMAAASAVRA